ncbi:MAG: heavy metal translocating P-type ATPase [Gammaproteobacteria bacterium]|nr:heavy metal translocating P-type ATPase [Gammaproteobacteria bacterium]MCP5135296.1 heavy metal translocating P-type ATPase [Gammaproteobacteria bacterium]
MSIHKAPCFHCGLPVPAEEHAHLEVLGEERHFCCHGCYAVCKTIVDQGLTDYYRHRDSKARRAEREQVPEVLRKLRLYDNPDIQRSFVRNAGAHRSASLILEDIRCAACLWLNEQHLRGLDGVVDVDIDYASQRARVTWDPEQIQLSDILEAIAAIGYVAYPYDASHREQLLKDQKRRSAERLIFAGLIGMPVMEFALATYLFPAMFANTPVGLELWQVIGRWTSLLAVIALLVYPAQDFFVGAWRDIKSRRLGMDVPIVLGIVTALIGSVVATIQKAGEVYYDSIAMFIFFLLIARYVEMRGRISAADALDRLARVVPETARRIDAQGVESEVTLFEIRPGDRVAVQAGENVPVDGRLLEGESAFDESLLTGESLPVHKRPGDELIGGSGNREQRVIMEVLRPTETSAANMLRDLLEQGMKARPAYAQLADRAATWFVGIVLTIAAITAGVWSWIDPAQALHNTVAVLIVTCPCALALATPVAIAIGAGRFAKDGILPLKMAGIEAFAQAQVMVFDKTGTLTRGTPALNETQFFGAFSEPELLHIAADLERANSHHPVARALVGAASAALDVSRKPIASEAAATLRHVPGRGVEGAIGGAIWRVGAIDFVCEAPSGTQNARIAALRQSSGLVIGIGRDGVLEGVFAFDDVLRSGAAELMSDLRGGGLSEFAVLSGDHPANVTRIAKAVGIDQAYGAMTSADKLSWIQARQSEGKRVIMIGDGINDAPTLAAADASLSFSGATEVAQAHSDFLILGEDLKAIPQVRRLALRTRRTVMQNLMWAAGYNLLAVPAAALGFIPPWGAAIGMSLSSLLVVMNALRLKRER